MKIKDIKPGTLFYWARKNAYPPFDGIYNYVKVADADVDTSYLAIDNRGHWAWDRINKCHIHFTDAAEMQVEPPTILPFTILPDECEWDIL